MSTGLELEYFSYTEEDKTEWYYALERWNAPKGAFDWMEYADCFGPFPSYIAASNHFAATQPNAGGSSTERYTYETARFTVKELVKRAEAPKGGGAAWDEDWELTCLCDRLVPLKEFWNKCECGRAWFIHGTLMDALDGDSVARLLWRDVRKKKKVAP